MDDFSDRWVISRIVRRYSDFVSYPIILKAEKDPEIEDLAKEKETGEKPEMPLEEKVLNSMKPIWTRPAVRGHRGRVQGVLPPHLARLDRAAQDDLRTRPRGGSSTRPCSSSRRRRRTTSTTSPRSRASSSTSSASRSWRSARTCCRSYLRFVRGVVDSPDLPLNVSREMLQQDRFITLIRKGLTKKILDVLDEMQEKDSETYLKFWTEFGRAIKEGVSSDYENKEKLLELLVFESSNDPEKLTTLKEYVERMKEGQNEIFYLTGESRSQVENSPHLEAFKEKGYEVLYLVDTVDELLTQSLHEYGGKRLKSVGKGTVSLGSEEEKKQTEEELKAKEEEMKPLLEALQKKLDANGSSRSA